MRALHIALFAATVGLISPSAQATGQQLPPEEELACDPGLGYLPSVRSNDIEAVGDGYSISISPVCPGTPDPALRLAGNVGGLHGTIAQNQTLSGALASAGYDADDVVGIRFGADNSVILYVHHAY